MSPTAPTMARRHALALLGALLAVLGLAACSTLDDGSLMDLLIDREETVFTNAAGVVTSSTGTAVVATAKPVVTAPLFVHDPFKDKSKCSKCHASERSVRLKTVMPDLCFECHKNFLKGRQKEEVHKPAFQGQCMSCHLPHTGPVTNLLKKAGAAFCYDCHDDWSADKKYVHKPVLEGKCGACHNAHVSDNNALLAKSSKEICADCHKPYQRAFVHKPVTKGQCLACHATHSTNNRGLVKRKGAEMCNDCHDPDDMKKVTGHKDIEDRDCAECHEMHDSVLPHLMKEGAH